MPRLIPLYIVIVSIVLPIMLSRWRRPKQALTILYVTMALLAFVWCMLCLRIYPRYVWPE